MLSSTELKERCQNLADVDEAICAEYEAIGRIYDTLGVAMDEVADLMFSNHVMCLLKRIQTGEYVPPMDEGLFSELTDRARSMAEELVGGAFKKAGQEPDKTEVLMLATHLDVAMAKKGDQGNE